MINIIYLHLRDPIFGIVFWHMRAKNYSRRKIQNSFRDLLVVPCVGPLGSWFLRNKMSPYGPFHMVQSDSWNTHDMGEGWLSQASQRSYHNVCTRHDYVYTHAGGIVQSPDWLNCMSNTCSLWRTTHAFWKAQCDVKRTVPHARFKLIHIVRRERGF